VLDFVTWHAVCLLCLQSRFAAGASGEAVQAQADRHFCINKLEQIMNITSKRTLGVLFAMACGVASAAPVNLVQNGSFEAGTTGWIIGGSGSQAPVAITYGAAAPYPIGAYGEAVPQNNAVTDSPDAVGTRAAYFVDDFAGNQSLSQMINIMTAGLYRIGFSAYAPANGFANRFDARFSGMIAGMELANYAVSSGSVTTWETFTGVTNLSAGNHLVQFTFNTNGNPAKDVVIDNVYVISSPSAEVPEPGSLALLGIAVAGLAVATRRKQKQG